MQPAAGCQSYTFGMANTSFGLCYSARKIEQNERTNAGCSDESNVANVTSFAGRSSMSLHESVRRYRFGQVSWNFWQFVMLYYIIEYEADTRNS